MRSIFRFYKWDEENLEALRIPYIFLYSAQNWHDTGEFDFDINIGSEENYRNFLVRKLREGYSLDSGSQEYQIFRANCIQTLSKIGLFHYIDTAIELDTIADQLLKETSSPEGINDRKELIKNNFFDKTGICCFTSEIETLSDRFHWNAFTLAGSGFCIEYNWVLLSDYFASSNRYIDGKHIEYYESKQRPQLNTPTEDINETIKNFYAIFYSLKQSLKDEKEFRLAKVYREKVDRNDPKRKELIPKESITSITLGPKIAIENENKIIGLCSNLYPHIMRYKIIEHEGNYIRHPYS